MLCQTLENGLVCHFPTLSVSLTHPVCLYIMKESSQCFWPEEQGKEEEKGEEGGREELYGKVKVGVKRESFHGDIVERRLEVEEESEGRTVAVTRTVTLLQLTSWDPGEQPHPTAILSLVDLLNKAQRTCPSRHTVIVCRYAPLASGFIESSSLPTSSVTELEGRGRSSVSILSWRDSRPKVWSTSSRLSSLLVSREPASSLMLYVPPYLPQPFIIINNYIFAGSLCLLSRRGGQLFG